MTNRILPPRPVRRVVFAGLAALALTAVSPAPASAQWAVFDATNFSQNVLTAARELQQINNEVISLQNEAQMLINQARNLTSLPYSALSQLTSTIQRTQQLLGQAQGIAYNVANIQSQFQSLYPNRLHRGDVVGAAHHRRADTLAEYALRLPGRAERRKQQSPAI